MIAAGVPYWRHASRRERLKQDQSRARVCDPAAKHDPLNCCAAQVHSSSGQPALSPWAGGIFGGTGGAGGISRRVESNAYSRNRDPSARNLSSGVSRGSALFCRLRLSSFNRLRNSRVPGSRRNLGSMSKPC